MTTGSERVSSTWRRPMRQVGPSSSSMRPNSRGRGLSARSDTLRESAATWSSPDSLRQSGPAAVFSAAASPTVRPVRGRVRLAQWRPRDPAGEWSRSFEPRLPQGTRKSAARKVPGHSGDGHRFRPLEQPLQQGFRLLTRLNIGPLIEGPYGPSLYRNRAPKARGFLKRVRPGQGRSPASQARAVARPAHVLVAVPPAAPVGAPERLRNPSAGPRVHGSVGISSRLTQSGPRKPVDTN